MRRVQVILCYIDPLKPARLRKTLTFGVKIKNELSSRMLSWYVEVLGTVKYNQKDGQGMLYLNV